MDFNEVKALISLLEDPDEEVFGLVSQNLENQGEQAIPLLEEEWHKTWDQGVQNRLENIIQNIQVKSLHYNLGHWIETGAEDLVKGCYYLEKIQFPSLVFEDLKSKLEKLQTEVWLEINDNLTALEKVRIINHVIFTKFRLAPNDVNFYSPFNNYLGYVLNSKRGNPISLALIYMIIAQKNGIPIYGVNLPKNFILAYVDEFYTDTPYDNILFYINPYKSGAVLSKLEIEYFLKQQNIPYKPEYFNPCANLTIINRLINNITFAFQKDGKEEKARIYKDLLSLFPEESGENKNHN